MPSSSCRYCALSTSSGSWHTWSPLHTCRTASPVCLFSLTTILGMPPWRHTDIGRLPVCSHVLTLPVAFHLVRYAPRSLDR